MRKTLLAIAMLVLGCGSTVTAVITDASTDAPAIDRPAIDVPAVDAPDAGAPQCPVGQRLVYTQGCDGRPPVCGPDTSGDAVVLVFCGCDGQDIRTNQSPPLRPWSRWGSCAPDAGPPLTDVPACPLPPLDLTACTHDDDCGQVERGCYCGRQPVTGVAERYRIDAARCELEAARNCALGCPVQFGFVADDGRNIDNGGSLANRCERTDAGVGRCRTYVP